MGTTVEVVVPDSTLVERTYWHTLGAGLPCRYHLETEVGEWLVTLYVPGKHGSYVQAGAVHPPFAWLREHVLQRDEFGPRPHDPAGIPAGYT